jgi:hypothetical protein
MRYIHAGDSIAWIIPNDHSATAEATDSFIVALQDIEEQVNYSFDIMLDKSVKPAKSWSDQRCRHIAEWRR